MGVPDALSRGAAGGPQAAALPATAVVGASGFLGSHLVARLAGHASIVAVARRQPTQSVPAGVSLASVDARDEAGLVPHLPREGAVVNLAYDRSAGAVENLAAARTVLRACARAGVARLVHVSTTAVFGPVRQRWLDEDTPCRPIDAYQRSKWEIEQMLRGERPAAVELVIVRPSAIFGRGSLTLRKTARDLLNDAAAVRWLRAGLFARRPLHLVSVDTVTAAIEHLLRRQSNASSRLFLVAEDEEPNNRFEPVAAVLARALGLPPPRVPPPRFPLLVLALTLRLGRRLVLDPRARFSSARLRQSGFSPPQPFDQAVATYAAELAAELRGRERVG